MKYFIGILIAVFILVFISLLLVGAPADFPVDSTYSVKSGNSLTQIANDLESKSIIRSEAVFQFFVILFAGDKNVIAGDYLLDKALSVSALAKRMVLGQYSMSAVKITILEGFNSEKISEVFREKLNNFDAEEFKNLAKAEEGYLFPDTYFFFPTTRAEEIIKVMRDNFDKKTESLQAEAVSLEKNWSDIIIMASIIEREAFGNGDEETISGILWKRFERKMLLQADAAPETYEKLGLPERAISNPGLRSIAAALYPAETPYLFYLHDKNGNIHYAKTFEEHRRNIRRYLK